MSGRPTPELLAEAQRADPSLTHCFEQAKGLKPDSSFFIDGKTSLLFRRWEHLTFVHYQLVVPKESRARILQLSHDEGDILPRAELTSWCSIISGGLGLGVM